jgi:hypothetical protein
MRKYEGSTGEYEGVQGSTRKYGKYGSLAFSPLTELESFGLNFELEFRYFTSVNRQCNNRKVLSILLLPYPD